MVTQVPLSTLSGMLYVVVCQLFVEGLMVNTSGNKYGACAKWKTSVIQQWAKMARNYMHAKKRGTTARTVTLLCRAPCFEKFLKIAAILYALYFDILNYLHSNSE